MSEAGAQAPRRVSVLAPVLAELNFMLGRWSQDSTGCSGLDLGKAGMSESFGRDGKEVKL